MFRIGYNSEVDPDEQAVEFYRVMSVVVDPLNDEMFTLTWSVSKQNGFLFEFSSEFAYNERLIMVIENDYLEK